MGIFSRMSDIVNSNINALLDSAEDPEKMIRLIIQEMEDTLVEVRSSSARVLADRKTAERKRLRIAQEVNDWEEKAKLAITKGREDLARAALQEKRAIEEELETISAELNSTDEHIEQLNDEVTQLQQKLSDAKAKQKALLMRSQTVHSRMAVKRQIHRSELDEAFSKFDKFERRMDNLEGELDAMDLGREGGLAAEIDALQDDDALNEELEALKQSMQRGESKKADNTKSSDI
ncbi:phage shock protein PspA [Luminiphilus sp.]|jgi:phage shock protein A|nr:phage shock protein PspA [Luminiphilus sp.]MDA8658613.1 phage shock protein PspA [Luminiphilus sp.]MDG1011937.1 phage shock protein PspA [Luminiphilus sp.]